MSGYTIAAVALAGLLVGGYLLHREHERRVAAELLNEWLEDYWPTRYALADSERATAQAAADHWRDRTVTVGAQYADTKRLLTAEQAYSNLCDRQLKKLADQVAGQALLPTLAADDVVVAFPKRGAL